MHTCQPESIQTSKAFAISFFAVLFVDNRYIHTAKVCERTNRKKPARNTLVQLLALYTNPDSHNAQRHRQTDIRTDRQTDDRIMRIADHTV